MALIMFRGNHYTPFVRKGRELEQGLGVAATAAPSISAAAGGRTEGGEPSRSMLPYLLVYDYLYLIVFNLSSLFLCFADPRPRAGRLLPLLACSSLRGVRAPKTRRAVRSVSSSVVGLAEVVELVR